MSNAGHEWPKDWDSKPIELLAAQVTSGGTPTSGDPRYYTALGGLPYAKTEDLTRAASKFVTDCELQITDAALRESAAKKYPVGTILISMYGTIGLAKITGQEMAANQALCALIPPFSCDRDYLFHHLEWMRPDWVRFSGQTTQANINGATVKSRVVPLPPAGEQKVVAGILDTLDTAIRETEAIIAKLKAVKQGLLHDLLTRGVDANGELRPPQAEAPHLYKQSPLGWIPKEWTADSIAAWTSASAIGPFGSDLVADNYRPSGVPVIFVRDVKPDRIEWKSNVFVSREKAAALSAHEVRPGDVVATKMGFPPCIAAVYPDSLPTAIITADIVFLRPIPSRIRSHWMSVYMNSPMVRSQVDQITAGVTRPKVTLRDVRDLMLAAPGAAEQDLIIDRIALIESKIRLEYGSLSKLHVEKAGLLDDLLTGRVRVTPLLSAEQRAQGRSA